MVRCHRASRAARDPKAVVEASRLAVIETNFSKGDRTMARLTSEDSTVATNIAPWLSVPDGDSAVEFYTTSFGAVELERRDLCSDDRNGWRSRPAIPARRRNRGHSGLTDARGSWMADR